MPSPLILPCTMPSVHSRHSLDQINLTQPNWIRDGPWDLCPKYLSLPWQTAMEIKSRLLTDLMGTKTDLRENKWWCQTSSVIPLKNQLTEQDPSAVKAARMAPSRWRWPQLCLRGNNKFQSICSKFLSSKISDVGPVSRPGWRATGRVRKGVADRGECQTKQTWWRQTERDSAYFKGFCSSSAPVQPMWTPAHILQNTGHRGPQEWSTSFLRCVQTHAAKLWSLLAILFGSLQLFSPTSTKLHLGPFLNLPQSQVPTRIHAFPCTGMRCTLCLTGMQVLCICVTHSVAVIMVLALLSSKTWSDSRKQHDVKAEKGWKDLTPISLFAISKIFVLPLQENQKSMQIHSNECC